MQYQEKKQEFSSCTVEQIAEIEMIPWPSQRPVNIARINHLYKEQLAFHQRHGFYLFPGTLVCIEYYNRFYIIDGQHRYETIKNLYNNRLIKDTIKNVPVTVEMYDSLNDRELANSIYRMVNDIYVTNGTIDDEGRVIDMSDDLTYVTRKNDIRKYFEKRFEKQIAATGRTTICAPSWDPGHFEKIMNEPMHKNIIMGLGNDYLHTIINVFDQFNNEAWAKISDAQRKRCISGLYCVYGNTECKWFSSILKKI